MLGTQVISDKITGEIKFGEFGRVQDLIDLDVNDKIILTERGGVGDEIVFFSEKEQVAADNGAKAIIVYNNESGIFYGELIHESIPENYTPLIPAVSMTREDGLILKEILETKTIGTMNVFNHPDFVAMFSSRGPVSPFYEKPDLVAPGVFVKTTSLDNKYNITSGTSYAAPHVSGAVALLLNKNPDFTPQEIKSKLITTSKLVTDQYGDEFAMNIAGAGRIDITNAFNSELLIIPTSLRFDLSLEKNTQTKDIHLKFDKSNKKIKIEFSDFTNVNFEYNLEADLLHITSKLISDNIGKFEGRLFITHNEIVHQIPIQIRISEATVDIIENDGNLFFEIIKPSEWTYAKITAINKNTLEKNSITFSPKENKPLSIFQSGEHWIESKITTDKKIFDVFDSIIVNSSLENKKSILDDLENTKRPILILSVIIVTIAIFGIRILKIKD